jgi:hypothetical protein
VRCAALEEASLDGSRLLAYLPGCILVNREPAGSGLLPDTSPNRITRSVLAAVYALLQVGGVGSAGGCCCHEHATSRSCGLHQRRRCHRQQCWQEEQLACSVHHLGDGQ